MKKLIVNADDFGLTKVCTEGIIKGIKGGIIGSTTIYDQYAANKTIKLAKENGITELGLHLTLTCGKLTLTYLDSHHHIHMNDGVREIVIKLAKEYNRPLPNCSRESLAYVNGRG
ncbi:ChbG/HpnK family deacetylase [Halonatronum saccharophilum]|uniref:ChbG/HpnK family deacetylase n=1 Tax=Halonatronum saccharophilum TaxID=150060 RepID=UPI0004AF92D4|nr:ChbG/HpnK family deacetylase [Halonatronum saccharophilum]